MKTIEERAKEFVQAPCTFKCDICDKRDMGTGCNWKHDAEVFSLGAKSEHDELTRWNSPDCPPEDDRAVLLKIKDTRYFPDNHYFAVGFYDEGYCTTSAVHAEIEVVGWREIHE